jgi:hypothetical protein
VTVVVVPGVVLDLRVEGEVAAWADYKTPEEGRRLLHELRDRDVIGEVRRALAAVYEQVADEVERGGGVR